MKFAASVSLAALALAGCATTPPAADGRDAPPAAAPAAAPAADRRYPMTAEGARAFVAAVEKDLFDLSVIGSRAAWVNATYINDDTDALAAYFGTIGTEKGVKYATRGGAIRRRSRASTSTPRASSTSCAARWCLPAPTDAGRGGRAQHHRDPPPVDLRQGPRDAQRQADHRRRCRSDDGHQPQPGRARRDVEELARQCRPADARRLCPHGRDRQRRAPRSSAMPTPARCGARNTT